MQVYDIGIIGAGVGGAIALHKIIKEYKNTKAVIFDIGRPPMKRRRQLEGWLGCLPNSDGKIYLNDTNKVSEITGWRKAKSGNTWVNNLLKNITELNVEEDKGPSKSIIKKIEKYNYQLITNDYFQLYPKDIHSLSKYIADDIDNKENIKTVFDTEIKAIHKHRGIFILNDGLIEYKCKKLIIATGRSGWRWNKNIYDKLGLTVDNSISRYGIKLEIAADQLKELNKSSCSLVRENEIEIGPFCWNGTVIPEDHSDPEKQIDMAISSFRSNEPRWKTDKVSFSLIGHRNCKNTGVEETDRIGKLTFVLSNDRIIKEKVSTLLNKKSKISIMNEYDWISNYILELSNIIPAVISKGYFYVPTLRPLPPKINLTQNLETDIEGLYVIGESAGLRGILSAMISGAIAVDSILK